MLRGLVKNEQLSSEQEEHIDHLQTEIDEIWNRRGSYQVDPDAWEDMPFFMEHISEEDIARNESCAALASIVYDEVPPDEVAENRKDHGNRALVLALNPKQDRREHLARGACASYTEALQAKGKDKKLTSVIYANRSLAQFIVGNYGHALEDAQRSIVLNPDYRKAYYRAAKSALALKKFDMGLQLLAKGRRITEPPMDAAATAEFAELETQCSEGQAKKKTEDTKLNRTVRAKAAKVSNMARAITDAGIVISNNAEVTSEELVAFGSPQPYFDTDGLLHVPLLFVYDEYLQSDIMHDVACDVCVAELLGQLMPFPWDDRERYSDLRSIRAFYKIDDGVKVPDYYEIDLFTPLLETFRSDTYKMPQLMPVLHVVCATSDVVEQWRVHRLK